MATADHTRVDVELLLRGAITTGTLVDLRDQPETIDPEHETTWEHGCPVPAALLAELLTEYEGPSRPRALRLAGAKINGVLDLEGAQLLCPLLLRDCWFDRPVSLTEANAVAIRLPGCHLPGLQATQLVTQGNLELNEVTATGEIRLFGAHIGGQLLLSEATLTNLDGPALTATNITVEQDMLCRSGFSTEGQVSLVGAEIGGQLDFSGATLNDRRGRALDAQSLTVTRAMLCGGFTAQGEVRLVGAHIGAQLAFVGATLTNPEGYALNAESITVEGNMLCRKDFLAQGEVRLVGAQVGGQLDFVGAALINPDGRALTVASVTVGQDVFCSEGFSAQGEVYLVGAHIGGQLDFSGATLSNPRGSALTGDRLTVDRSMFCTSGFTTKGELRLVGAHIGGQLGFVGATLANPDGWAIDLESAHVGELLLLPTRAPNRVDLSHATVGMLHDDPATWPEELHLVGLAYDALVEYPAVSAKQRLGWLRRDPGGYTPQPYEQLAAVYRRAGREEDARRVAIAKQRERRRALPLRDWRAWPARLWSLLLGGLLGHGYRTWMAAGWLLLMLAVGTLVYHRAYPTHMRLAKPGEPAPAFQPAVYALDVLLPVVDLDQQAYWIPDGLARWWTWASILAGWVLTTAVVAALTGLLKRE